MVNPQNTMIMYELAWPTAMLGNMGYARELIGRSMTLDPSNPYVHYYDALLSLREGRPDAAVDALRETIELGYPTALLAAEPYLIDLRQNANFADLVSEQQ